MPKTIVQISTMFCPTGLGNPNASCRFHRASNNMTPDGKCPTCKLALVKSTDPQDKITMTVMGEEDIETEIEQRDESNYRLRKKDEIESFIIAKKKERGMLQIVLEFLKLKDTEETELRKKTLEQMEMEIVNFKKQNFFLTTPTQQNTYREKRKEDIRKAIIEAKKLEDK